MHHHGMLCCVVLCCVGWWRWRKNPDFAEKSRQFWRSSTSSSRLFQGIKARAAARQGFKFQIFSGIKARAQSRSSFGKQVKNFFKMHICSKVGKRKRENRVGISIAEQLYSRIPCKKKNSQRHNGRGPEGPQYSTEHSPTWHADRL